MYSRINRKMVLLVNLILGQVLVVAVNTMWGLYDVERQSKFPVHYIFGLSVLAEVVLAFASIYLIKEILRLSKIETDSEITALSLKKSKELINVMRSQRHDFLNHIQVIYGLARLEKIDQISSYIGELRNSMETKDALGSIAQVEFAAFLLNKKCSAVEQGITFDLEILTDLAYVGIPTNELVSIVGNLVDNALYAVRENSGTYNKVLLKINEDDKNYALLVANTGPKITEEVKKQMFIQGFTTKGENGSGLGLYIISNLVKKSSGSIELVEEPGFNVCFEVKLPKIK
ncbi:MAG TPA: Spo0B domain-containing protein [Desulfobacteria bacterium]|nr:Spo0B domain-containing protein [Desulfobacteria bacterium]